jgi:hypothetical protein
VILADVKSAFLRIVLNEKDRDATRFLWPRDINDLDAGYDVFRFTKLLFGFKPSPYILAACTNDGLKRRGTPVAEEIHRNIYVDNIVMRAESAEEATNKIAEAKEIFNSMSMPLREFISNCPDAVSTLDQAETLHSKICKVLGMHWDTEPDNFIFRLPSFEVTDDWSLRMATRITAKPFDPIGLIAPCIVPAKGHLKKAWQWLQAHKLKEGQDEKAKWDSPLPTEQIEEWKKVAEDWRNAEFVIPRKVTAHSNQTVYELHSFGDASEDNYGCAIYLVSRTGSHSESNLIMAKGRVRPSQGKWTIPRLELNAAVLATRGLAYVESHLDITAESCSVYTDASCVVDWVKGAVPSPENRKFVENRRQEIWTHEEFIFRHVPGVLNPADIISRGADAHELKDNSMWFHGPEFLLKSDTSCWPPAGFLITGALRRGSNLRNSGHH